VFCLNVKQRFTKTFFLLMIAEELAGDGEPVRIYADGICKFLISIMDIFFNFTI
jgi:hypothetical protein